MVTFDGDAGALRPVRDLVRHAAKKYCLDVTQPPGAHHDAVDPLLVDAAKDLVSGIAVHERNADVLYSALFGVNAATAGNCTTYGDTTDEGSHANNRRTDLSTSCFAGLAIADGSNTAPRTD